ncbi:hypothetical protein BD410DRAFT_782758 [Rickenella mellea]|uniref:DUF1766-domain-containing protein n=1 Tax=Rickenella mellea TaxID=50990 RepID=A0A4Y7QK62_9AGAM|nr:hypothetical protein BD410DRAFT_782758 [Rickenella mellea]
MFRKLFNSNASDSRITPPVPAPPPPPPPKGELITGFNALSLSSPSPTKSDEHFVGGFRQGRMPETNDQWTYVRYLDNPNSPPQRVSPERRHPGFPTPERIDPSGNVQGAMNVRPTPKQSPPRRIVDMHIPQYGDHLQPSLTMQHALSAPALSAPAHSGGSVSNPTTPAASTRPKPDALQVSTPSRRPRAASSPPSPTASRSAEGDTVFCSGTTKKQEKCTRKVKAGAAYDAMNPEANTPRFCFQHIAEIMGQSGLYLMRNGNSELVKFDSFIALYLKSETQAALRTEMGKARSDADEDGYIYAFEILDPSRPDFFDIKVGRTNNLTKRIDRWGKQCGSKETILRGYWPVREGEQMSSLMKGLIKPGPPGPNCHRLERLIHLELADLVLHTPYLNGKLGSDNTNNGASISSSTTASKSKKKSPASTPAGLWNDGKPCNDCGAVHREIFSFTRPKKGPYKGREWEAIVQPVIEKWGKFVEVYV